MVGVDHEITYALEVIHDAGSAFVGTCAPPLIGEVFELLEVVISDRRDELLNHFDSFIVCIDIVSKDCNHFGDRFGLVCSSFGCVDDVSYTILVFDLNLHLRKQICHMGGSLQVNRRCNELMVRWRWERVI